MWLLFQEHLLAGGLQWLWLQEAVNPERKNLKDWFLRMNLCLEYSKNGELKTCCASLLIQLFDKQYILQEVFGVPLPVPQHTNHISGCTEWNPAFTIRKLAEFQEQLIEVKQLQSYPVDEHVH